MNQDLPSPPTGVGAATPEGTSPAAALRSHLSPLASQIPDHKLLRPIGHGSYGEVWLARTVLGELRAVKIVHRSSFDDNRPYEREFEGLQKFAPISRSHPSQLAILHVGRHEADGCFYYVMELADDGAVSSFEFQVSSSQTPATGQQLETQNSKPETYLPHTLRSDLKQHGRLPVAQCVEIGLALAEALTHLHKHDLVHRDIKPSNIIFVGGVPKLADIGLVTDVDASRSFVGTEGYLPPEGPGTPQADIYGLGKVLYELCTGKDRKDYPALPPDLRERPESEQRELLELNAVLVKACATDPRQRYQSAQEMAAELALLQGGQSVRRARGNQRLWSQVKKAALGLALLALVVAGIARLARQPQRNEAAEGGPPSTNELANALCAKALHIIRGDQYPAFAEAYTNFHQAIRLDPHFARPYVGLLELRVAEYVPTLPAVSLDEMRGIMKKLNELAPQIAMTYCAQSYVAWLELDYVKAREYGLRATRADPDCAFARGLYGWMLTDWGWPAEARMEIEAARRLSPSKATYYQLLANTYYMERDFSKAIAMYRQALRWEPHRPSPYESIAKASLAMGDYLTAISSYEQIPIIMGTHDASSKAWYDELRQAVAEQGALGYWRKREAKYAKHPEANFYDHAACQMHLGNTNGALVLLEKSVETHERVGITPAIYVLLWDETWDGLHENPGFKSLLDKIGYTKVMPKRR